MLKFENIKKSYGKSTIIDGVSFTVSQGECVVVVGQNSTGKTTLLSMGADLIKPTEGSVKHDGAVSFVPQQENLLNDLTVYDNVSLWYCANNLNVASAFSDCSYEKLLGLEEYKKFPVKSLSGGRKKRLSIALSLINEPSTVIMDEPYSSLDIVSAVQVTKILKDLKSKGKGLLISTHNISQMWDVCDRILILENGLIIKEIDQKDEKLAPQQLEAIICNCFGI